MVEATTPSDRADHSHLGQPPQRSSGEHHLRVLAGPLRVVAAVGEPHLGGRDRHQPDLASLAGRPLARQMHPTSDHQANTGIPERDRKRVRGEGRSKSSHSKSGTSRLRRCNRSTSSNEWVAPS